MPRFLCHVAFDAMPIKFTHAAAESPAMMLEINVPVQPVLLDAGAPLSL